MAKKFLMIYSLLLTAHIYIYKYKHIHIYIYINTPKTNTQTHTTPLYSDIPCVTYLRFEEAIGNQAQAAGKDRGGIWHKAQAQCRRHR